MAACHSCGADLPGGARFCASCGAPVAGELTDERKIVTVLFADLVGSTATGSVTDPEEFGAAIRPRLAQMREALDHYGGTIEKYIGDAVMAVFGAPVVREDDPERAVRAALAIREALGDAVRVAVNTGEVVVSLGARADRGEELVLGDVVNTAFRIEEATPDGAIMVGEATYRATSGAIVYGERQLIEAKGKPQPVPVWQAIEARSTDRSATRGAPLSPLVGRTDELTLILKALTRAARQRAVQLVTLVGPPGIGKSRLLSEVEWALEEIDAGWTWRRGRCLPYGGDGAYAALEEIVKVEAGIDERDDAAGVGEKLRASVGSSVAEAGEAEWVESQLRRLVGLEGAARERRDETFSAWRTYLEALSDRGPLVLAIEDLHWADEELLEFIEHVADWSRDAPLLLLCTARPELSEQRPSWGGHGNSLTITLPPLGAEETVALISSLLPQPAVPDELREALLARADGNPLYAEEFVRMLVDRELLEPGNHWGSREAELPMPQSVHGIIAARLDALSGEEKRLLQAAAVVGRAFWPDAVAAVASIEAGAAAPILQGLERRGLIRGHRASTVAGQSEYSFRHALVREVAYAQIPRARRGESHLRAAAWAESLGRPDDHAETIAAHYLAGLEFARGMGTDVSGRVAAARSALRRAGDRSHAVHAYGAAAKFLGAALELAPPEDEQPLLLLSYAKALSRTAAPDEALVSRARDDLLARGDVERAVECQVILSELLWRQGQREAAFAQAQQAVQLLEARPASYAKAHALNTLAGLRIRADQPDAAIEAAEAVMELAAELGLDDLRASALNRIGVARAATGDRSGLDDLEQSIEIAERANSPESVRGYFNLGGILANLGDLHRAAAMYAEGRRGAERFGDAAWLEYFEAERVYEDFWSGDWDAALALAEQLIDRADNGTSPRSVLDGCLVRGWISLARGDIAQASADADRALEFGLRAGDPQNLYPALAFRARTCLETAQTSEASGHVDELLRRLRGQSSFPSFWAVEAAIVLAALGRGGELAEAAAQAPPTRWLEAANAYAAGQPLQAAELCAAIGALPDEAHMRSVAAAVLAADGRETEAADQLGRALDFYQRVDATAYLERARRGRVPA